MKKQFVIFVSVVIVILLSASIFTVLKDVFHDQHKNEVLVLKPYIESIQVIQDPYGSYGYSAMISGSGFGSSTQVLFYDNSVLQNITDVNILDVSSDGKKLTFSFPFEVEKTHYMIRVSNNGTMSNEMELLPQVVDSSTVTALFIGYHFTVSEVYGEENTGPFTCDMFKVQKTDDPLFSFLAKWAPGTINSDGSMNLVIDFYQVATSTKQRILYSTKNNPISITVRKDPFPGKGLPACRSVVNILSAQ